MFFPHPSSRHRIQWRLVEDIACPCTSTHLPSKSCAPAWWIHRFSQPHHCVPQWLSTVFPTPSLPPATACGQSVCGRPPRQPQRCPHWFMKNRWPGQVQRLYHFSSASFTMFSTSLSVSLYAIHTRTSPPNSIHRHVLQPFALPRPHLPESSTRLSEPWSDCQDWTQSVCLDQQSFSKLLLRAVSSDLVHPSRPTSPMLWVSQSSLVLKTSPTFPHYHSSALPRRSRRLLSRSSPGAVCTGLAWAAISAMSADV